MSVTCIHIRNAKAGDYYCGRASSFYKAPAGVCDLSVLGNPFFEGTSVENIAHYKKYLKDKINNDAFIHGLMNRLFKESLSKDIRLVCFCKPKPCHTDVIKEFLDNERDIYVNRD